MGDFNARFGVSPGANATNKKATEALQGMARRLGLAEAMHWLGPGWEPSTYIQSDKQGANKSWIWMGQSPKFDLGGAFAEREGIW